MVLGVTRCGMKVRISVRGADVSDPYPLHPQPFSATSSFQSQGGRVLLVSCHAFVVVVVVLPVTCMVWPTGGRV